MSKSTKGTPGKQTNLFSFFNKVTIPKSDNNNNTTSTSTTNNNNNNKEKDYIVVHEDGSAFVNKRIKVWWPDDQEWYSGIIKSFDFDTSKHTVLYDDNQLEILDLKKEKYVFIDNDENNRGIKRTNESITTSTKVNNHDETIHNNNNNNNNNSDNTKSNRRVIHDDDEDEDEDESPIKKIKKPKSSKKVISEDEEEWCESEEEHSVDMDLDLEYEPEGDNKDDDGDYNEQEKSTKKKRKLSTSVENNKSKSTKSLSIKSSSSTSSTILSKSNLKESQANLPPRPSISKITTEVSSPAKTYQQFNASTPSPTRSRIPTSPTSMRSVSPSPSIESKQGNTSQNELSENVGGYGSHEHHSWDFLTKYRKDKTGKPVDHPEFNPRTILFPPTFIKEQTPAMKQWCEVKADNFDVVIFFKVGKFYELFHMDADIGVSEADLIYMKGTKAHSGFPEVAYGKYASLLVSKGYKVARIEQTETPEMMKDRNKSAQKGMTSKVVAREVCSILSKGTRTFCHLDDLSILDDNLTGDSSSILTCICEHSINNENNNDNNNNNNNEDNNIITSSLSSSQDSNQAVVEYGVCIVNTVLGTITLAQFEDDVLRNRLRTLICRYLPTEVLLEFGCVSNETLGVLQLLAPKASKEFLRNNEMPKANKVPSIIHDAKYFLNNYPPILQAALNGLEDGSSEYVVRAIGGVIWQLKRCKIDYETFSLGRIYAYVPPDLEYSQSDTALFTDNLGGSQLSSDLDISQYDSNGQSSIISSKSSKSSTTITSNNLNSNTNTNTNNNNTTNTTNNNTNTTTTGTGTVIDINSNDINDNLPRHMILDAVTLTNLEILVNNFDHTPKGSLFSFMNRCKTPFGKRLLKEWICKPLLRPSDIQNRVNAVSELMDNFSQQVESSRVLLKGCPDIERLLSRVHSNGLSKKLIDHPDSRAIMYEDQIYNSRKIRDFADVLKGFDIVVQVVELFQSFQIESQLLKMLLLPPPIGKFPLKEIKKTLAFFRQIFDENQAKKEGFIRPLAGVDSQYDDAVAEVANIERSFETYLKEQKKQTGIMELCYFGSNKDRYQLEVPMAKVSNVPKDWASKSQKKTHRRYWTSFIENNLSLLTDAEEKLAFSQKDTMRRVFEKFDSNQNIWRAAVSCIAILDSLFSLVSVSSLPNYNWAQVISRQSNKNAPQFNVIGGRHPMLEQTLAEKGDSQFIANDLSIGGAIKIDNNNNNNNNNEDSYNSNHSEHEDIDPEYHPRIMLVSGPNMGGKSTLLRQTCLIAIMSQIGCRVPAESCILTPVDRIFTRIGASDKILSGQSTFYVELAETAIILKHATIDSFCILDELGRGTSTFDGTAIAHSVVEYLVSNIRCRTLFATHYHTLINDWSIDPRIKLGHMDCLVNLPSDSTNLIPEQLTTSTSLSLSTTTQTTATTTTTTGYEEVTFLYRLCDGSSPRSYGINVARLAKLPQEVIELAYKQSREFEEKMAGNMNSQKNKIVIMNQFYERLVSILNSKMEKEEIYWVTVELWRRYSHISSRVIETIES